VQDPGVRGLAVFALASRSTQNMTTQDIARLLVQLCPTELLFVELAFSAWTVLENLCLFVWWAWVCFVIAAGALKCLVVWRWFAAHGGNPERGDPFTLPYVRAWSLGVGQSYSGSPLELTNDVGELFRPASACGPGTVRWRRPAGL